MPVILNFEDKILNLIRGERYKWFTTGVNLGGVTGVSGGTGGPLGGFIGQLIQSKVTYDTSENEIWDVPVSGESLVTNLDRIRYRLAIVESSGGGTTLAILDDGDWVASGVETLDFIGVYDITTSGTKVTLTFSGGGGSVSDLDDLADVVITSVGDNEVLAYDSGGDWINQTAAEAGLSETGHSHVETDITDLDHDAVSIQGVDVVAWGPTASGEVLVYDGNVYAPGTVSGGDGSTTFLGLTDTPSAYADKYGYSAVVNLAEDGLEFINVSGGGGSTPDFTIWMPDAHPASGYSTVSTSDDEFDDTSFDTSLWTEFDVAGTQTVGEEEYGVTLSTTSSNHLQGIWQPVPSGITEWSFTTYVTVPWDRDNTHRAGILLLEDINNLSTSECWLWANYRGGAGYGWQGIYHTDYDTWSIDDYNSAGVNSQPFSQYLRFRRDGTNWHFDWSPDGKSWISEEYTRTKRWDVTGIGLGLKFDNSSMIVSFPFARFKDDFAKTQLLYGDRVKMWRA